jgi:hypothetical protein
MHDRILETYRCELLLRELSYCADLGDRAAAADLFVPDGEFHIGDLRLVGREAIREWFVASATPTRPLVRHVCTNTTVRFTDDRTAEATTYLLLYRDPTGPTPPVVLRDAPSVGLYNDVLVKVDDEWRFLRHVYEPTFSIGA